MKLEEAMARLLTKCAFFGRIAANVDYIEDETCLSNGQPTFATDGKKVYYHPEALQNANMDTLEYLLGHELYHIAYRHLERRKEREPETWNIAADAVVNAFLEKVGILIPKNSVNEPWAIDYSVEEVYEKMKKDQKEDPDYKMPQSHDIHYENLEKQENSNKESSNNMSQEATEKRKKLQEEIKKFVQTQEKDAESFNNMAKKENLEELRKRLVEKTQEKTNASSRNLSNIGTATEEVDWRTMLANSITVGQDWSFLIPEIEDDILKPQLIDIEESYVEILLDTSGSVNSELLRNFLRECKNILYSSTIKIGCFDDEFYGFQEITTEEDIEAIPLSGGGGTDFDVAVNAFTEEATNRVIFTDGKAPMPKKEMDAIWLVYGERKISPAGGTVIPISEKQYSELNNMRTNGKSR